MTCNFFSGCAFLLRTPAYQVPKAEPTDVPVYRGVYHVHTEFSPDSKASLEKVIKTAQSAGLDYVVVTDHNNRNGAQAYAKMRPHPNPLPQGEGKSVKDTPRPQRGRGKGEGEDPLLIFGEEVSAADGHIVALGLSEDVPSDGKSSQEVIDWIRGHGGAAFLAHPVCRKNPWRNWQVRGYEGMEVYNFTHSLYAENKFKMAAKSFLLPKGFLKSTHRFYPDSFKRWDEQLERGRVSAFGAVDAHIHVQWLGLAAESYLLQFQSVTMYALAPELTEEAIVESLRLGRSFLAFDYLGDARGFRFEARAGEHPEGPHHFLPGDAVSLDSGPVTLVVRSPEDADIRLIHRGRVAAQANGNGLIHPVSKNGAYRVEVWKDGHLWIVGNPIYVE